MSGKGENIYERKDGRFEARYLTGRDENGRTKYSSVYGKSRAEVREKLAEVKRELYGNPSPHEAGLSARLPRNGWRRTVTILRILPMTDTRMLWRGISIPNMEIRSYPM